MILDEFKDCRLNEDGKIVLYFTLLIEEIYSTIMNKDRIIKYFDEIDITKTREYENMKSKDFTKFDIYYQAHKEFFKILPTALFYKHKMFIDLKEEIDE